METLLTEYASKASALPYTLFHSLPHKSPQPLPFFISSPSTIILHLHIFANWYSGILEHLTIPLNTCNCNPLLHAPHNFQDNFLGYRKIHPDSNSNLPILRVERLSKRFFHWLHTFARHTLHITEPLRMLSTRKMPSTKTILSAAASLAASTMLIRTIVNDFVPDEARNYFFSNLRNMTRHFSSELAIVIEEFQGLSRNEVFEAADTYLGMKLSPSVQRFRVSKDEKETKLAITVDRNEEVIDDFDNVQVKWRLICQRVESSNNTRHQGDLNTSLRSEVRYFELIFHKKHKEKVLNFYLPYILERSKAIKEENKSIKLHTAEYGCWGTNTLPLDHPMTFKNLAMDSKMKEELVDDLEKFKKGREYYRRIGKAWKRGYLLYGPPGTGKSSLIAAMANHLNYDIYDLDLTNIHSNSDLRVLLLSMSNQSILVVEDIDCNIKLQNRESEEGSESTNNPQTQVTLSGLLNFIDGIWSCCGDERVIVFTTNYKDRLDPALLRPGRMDMHIHMSYCTISAFKQLALNYLGICHHQLFETIEELVGEVEVTPAEVAGELMKNNDAQVSLQGLVEFLHHKKSEQDKAKLDKKIED